MYLDFHFPPTFRSTGLPLYCIFFRDASVVPWFLAPSDADTPVLMSHMASSTLSFSALMTLYLPLRILNPRPSLLRYFLIVLAVVPDRLAAVYMPMPWYSITLMALLTRSITVIDYFSKEDLTFGLYGNWVFVLNLCESQPIFVRAFPVLSFDQFLTLSILPVPPQTCPYPHIAPFLIPLKFPVEYGYRTPPLEN